MSSKGSLPVGGVANHLFSGQEVEAALNVLHSHTAAEWRTHRSHQAFGSAYQPHPPDVHANILHPHLPKEVGGAGLMVGVLKRIQPEEVQGLHPWWEGQWEGQWEGSAGSTTQSQLHSPSTSRVGRDEDSTCTLLRVCRGQSWDSKNGRGTIRMAEGQQVEAHTSVIDNRALIYASVEDSTCTPLRVCRGQPWDSKNGRGTISRGPH